MRSDIDNLPECIVGHAEGTSQILCGISGGGPDAIHQLDRTVDRPSRRELLGSDIAKHVRLARRQRLLTAMFPQRAVFLAT